MLEFPNLGDQPEPHHKRMTPMEYLRFCESCIRNNPRITAESCLDRKTGEEEITVPFRIK